MSNIIVPSNHVVNNPNNYNRIIAVITACLVFLVALGSFALSYNALKDVAITNGITGNLSYVWPLLVDFSLVVFSLSVVNAYLQSESTTKQWLLVGVYSCLTVGFNVLHAPANIQAQVVAAIAPVSLFFSFELLMSQLKTSVKKYGIASNIATMQDHMQKHQDYIDRLNANIERKEQQLQRLNDAISIAKSDNAINLQDARQAKIASRRAKVLELLQEGLQEKEIAARVGVKDVRTIRSDIAALNGKAQGVTQ